ncbi:MAG TPA: toll/interleukin-1 receptor domain-containing protein [Puia sp.]|jgi:hypothetical protein|nr:toll/interleukin-1 receptor domain-containing protein [Puia sp.]
MPEKVKVFLSYSHLDCNEKSAFLSQFSSLTRTENVVIWSDDMILPGKVWDSVIMEQLNSSHLIICLVSSNFISSDYAYVKELGRALEIEQANKGNVIIPVLLRNTSLTDMPISIYQTLPTDPRYIDAWPNPNDAWVDVIEGIRKQVRLIADNLKVWDPVSASENIRGLLGQSQKLEEACNKIIDFAVNYRGKDDETLAVTYRTKLTDIEYMRSEAEKTQGSSPTFWEVLDARQKLRLELFQFLNKMMTELSNQATRLKSDRA